MAFLSRNNWCGRASFGPSSMNSSVGQALPHDAADRHVQGNAQYIDDVDLVAGTLHAAIGQSPVAHGLLRHLDLTAVCDYPGVVDLVDASSILGNANIGSVLADENLFADKQVEFAGQAVFAVAAHTMAQARKAVRLAKFSIRELPTILTIEEALAADSYIIPAQNLPEITNGWKPAVMRRSPYVLKGQVHSGAQEHFYLEGQVAYALPQDDGKILVHASTQHPSEIQHIVAGVLAVPFAHGGSARSADGWGFWWQGNSRGTTRCNSRLTSDAYRPACQITLAACR